MKKIVALMLMVGGFFFIPSYSQNIVNVSLSTQEMRNGIALFNERRYAAAMQAFELALSYEPLNHAAKYRYGLAALYSGYAQSAIRIWEELVDAGVANHQAVEQLNALYFRVALDEGYEYQDPYIFREYYNGFTDGGHDVYRTSFIIYDEQRDLKYISSIGEKQVVQMDSANSITHKYGSRLFLPSLLSMPTGLAVNGNLLYVADYRKNRVFVFDRDRLGALESTYGETGSLSNQILGPMGINISEDNYLYVVDNGNHRIQKFLLDGTHVYHFGEDYLFRPTDIVTKGDRIYVTDIDNTAKGRLVVFDNGGNFITNIGDQFLKEPRGLFLDEDTITISDSTGSLYTYQIDTQTTSVFKTDDKLSMPFDMTKDKDQIIWRTDFNSEKIAIYVPLQGVYANVSLDISQVITDRYPYVYSVMRARNKDGSPITGITKEELTLTEFDQPVKDLLVGGAELYRDKMQISFIIDRSLTGEQYIPQLEYYYKSFVSNMGGEDLLDIVLIDDKEYLYETQNATISKSWAFITNYSPKSSVPVAWDVSIYNSVTKLLNNFRNRAIVIFTSGAGDTSSFSVYGSDIIKTYADQNNIPIYVVNFSDKNNEIWEKIAEESYGRYLQSNLHAKDILNLHQIIKDAPPLEYLIEYTGIDYADIPGLWIDVVLRLERFGLNGVVTDGYYVPTPQEKTLNLYEQFFPPEIEDDGA